LASLQSELDRLAGRYAGELTHLALTEAKADAARADIQRLRTRMLGIQARLATRARDAYESGGADSLELLLTSDSCSQFSDRGGRGRTGDQARRRPAGLPGRPASDLRRHVWGSAARRPDTPGH